MANIEGMSTPQLISIRGVQKTQITKFKQFVEGFGPDGDHMILESRLKRIEEVYATFNHVQMRLEMVDAEAHGEYRFDVEDVYFATHGAAKRILREHDRERASTPAQSATESRIDGNERAHDSWIALPAIQSPQFNGTIEDWPSFSNAFQSAIGSHPRLRDSQRLSYLLSCVSGPATDKIRQLDITDQNYAVAWEILKRNYDQPAHVIFERIRKLVNLPRCTGTSDPAFDDIIDTATTQIQSLQAMGRPFLEMFPVYLVFSKLDESTRVKWNEKTAATKEPRVADLLEFLHDQRRILASARASSAPETSAGGNRFLAEKFIGGKRGNRHAPYSRPSRTPPEYTFVAPAKPVCGLCGGSHTIYTCERLTKASVQDRSILVRTAGLCFNCLRGKHSSADCQARACRKCGKGHHTLLHMDRASSPAGQTPTVVTNQAIVKTEQVLLSTAVVLAHDKHDKPHSCRILLDVGSQSNFMTHAFAKRLGLAQHNVAINVSGISQVISKVTRAVNVYLRSRVNGFACKTRVLIRDTIVSELPSQHLNRTKIQIPADIKLADPEFHKPRAIDALLGAELFYELLRQGQIAIPGQRALLQNTQFGWVISGRVCESHPPPDTVCSVSLETLQESIARFWTTEEVTRAINLSSEERECEKHYALHTVRDGQDGRYTVRLPFRTDATPLGQSYKTALRQFHELERRLDRRPELKCDYHTFMREYEQLGHMSLCEASQHHVGYYLPHHAVLKQSSVTTKLRVVFNASASTSTGTSLNQILMTGPTIQDDIFSLIVRFRSHRVALTADISKMYRQVRVHNRDRVYQKILWREDANEPIRTYQLNTVTYGTTAAPFLAIRTLHQLADDEARSLAHAAVVLKRDFYVDDLLSGAETIETARKIRDELTELTRRGGFELRQWASNEPSLISDLADGTTDTKHRCLSLDETTKTLGIYWNPLRDDITYLPTDTTIHPLTKRTILSRIASLYDPLGLIGPVIVQAKLLMQQLWLQRTDWDATVPQTIATNWEAFTQNLRQLHQFRLPRTIFGESRQNTQLHAFADASERAFGACVYARSVDTHGKVTTSLICSKSRVAPLKTITLPRLELCAAVLACKLARSVIDSLRSTVDRVTYWTDSTITLQWINHSPHLLKTFVANRVSEIQSCSGTSQWRHVRSSDNPADIVSRGATPQELCESALWQIGPTWLRDNETQWPKYNPCPLTELPEQKTVALLTSHSPAETIVHRFSDFNKLVRVVAYCLRFGHNARSRDMVRGPLSPESLAEATLRVIKNVQAGEFAEELKQVTNTGPVRPKSRLSPLAPFVDDRGILRVGGRLKNATIPFEYRHPILLPRRHHLTTLIVRHYHAREHHAGLQGTLGAIRQEYWPLGGRTTVKEVVNHCVICHRANPSTPTYPMGDLPRVRVGSNRPFLTSGVDYCGPFYVKERKHRNRGKVKIFAAIFVCLVTKAVHVELVTDLTTEAFIAALRRFVARRGKPQHMYSDNATTFVGADREFREIHELLTSAAHNDTVSERLSTERIYWHFIPPRSPHFGGLWEAAVKSFKRHIVRVIGTTILSLEAMLTYASEVEAILNSRPLTPLSSDPNDLQALTPAHFLIGDTITGIPEHDVRTVPSNKLSVWQHTQQMRQHWWSRWYKEYLHELTVRKKWHHGRTTSCKLGTMVLLNDPDLPPMQWRLGRVTAVHPGPDGQVRVATVKTARGEYKRAITKLSPLPLDQEEQ